jgi:hypothetical protein
MLDLLKGDMPLVKVGWHYELNIHSIQGKQHEIRSTFS